MLLEEQQLLRGVEFKRGYQSRWVKMPAMKCRGLHENFQDSIGFLKYEGPLKHEAFYKYAEISVTSN